MNTLLDQLSLPFRTYEAFVPFAVWMMAEKIATEDVALLVCGPMIALTGRCPFIAARRDQWIDAVVRLRDVVYLV